MTRVNVYFTKQSRSNCSSICKSLKGVCPSQTLMAFPQDIYLWDSHPLREPVSITRWYSTATSMYLPACEIEIR